MATGLTIDYADLDCSSIQRITESLQPNEHMYIENVSQRGRLAVWGVSDDTLRVEVQYTACGFEAEPTGVSFACVPFLVETSHMALYARSSGILLSE